MFTFSLPSWYGYVGVGACDYYWSNLSGLRYASCGGRCYDGLDCGCSCLHAHASSANAYWSVGACDYLWVTLSGLQSAFSGGRCGHETLCGVSFLQLAHTPEFVNWHVGACCDHIIIWDSSWPNEVRLSSVGGAYANAWIDTNLDCGMFDFEIRLAEWSGFRFIGACDSLWSVLSDIRCALYGGICFDGTYCGAFDMGVDGTAGDGRWYLGACDYYWNLLSGFRYTLCGGRWDDGVSCGWSYLSMYCVPTRTYWDIGACIVITLGVISMVSGLLCMVADVRIRHSVVRITFP